MKDIEEKLSWLARNYTEDQTFGKWSNPESKLVSLLLVFDSQVLNGGLLQWYGNPCGDFLKETVRCFELVNCPEISNRLKGYCENYFGTLKFTSYENRSIIIDDLLGRPENRSAIIEGFDYWYEDQREFFVEKLMNFLQSNDRDKTKVPVTENGQKKGSRSENETDTV